MSDAIFYLSIDDVLLIHERQIVDFGGTLGILNREAIESAIAMPMAAYGGQDVHPSLFDKASAYIFHLAKNHPFCDGNKRVAADAAVIFLKVNGFDLLVDQMAFADIVLAAVSGEIEKPEIAKFLEQHSQPSKR